MQTPEGDHPLSPSRACSPHQQARLREQSEDQREAAGLSPHQTKQDRTVWYASLDTSLGRIFFAYRRERIEYLSREHKARFLREAESVCGMRPRLATRPPTKLLATLVLVIESLVEAMARFTTITTPFSYPPERLTLLEWLDGQDEKREEAADES